VDVVPVSFKQIVRLHGDEDVEIAAGAAGRSFFAFLPHPEPGPRFHARGYLELDGLARLDLSQAGTAAAGTGDHAASPPAMGTGGADAEEAAGLSHLTAAPAKIAGLRRRTRRATGSATVRTDDRPFHLDLDPGPKRGVQEGHP